MTTVEFAHAIGDAVRVVHAGDIVGRVIEQNNCVYGQMYRVVWWQDGRRVNDWLHDWELERAAP